MQHDESVRIAISGSYGGINLGDEAILHGILGELRRSMPAAAITVFSRDPADTLRRHRVHRAVQLGGLPRREALETVAGVDLFVLGGGGILFDADAGMFLRELCLAHEVGTPSMVYAVSAGPLADPQVRSRVREALDATDVVTVRDQRSLQILDDLGVRREVTLTADPALLVAREPLTLDEILRAEAIDPDARLIGFSVREPGPAAPKLDVEHYHRLVANAADFVVDRLDAEVVFFPLERRNVDVQHSHGVVGQMQHAQRATVLKREYTPGQIVSLLEHFEFAIGMRLHFLVFSALAGVPFVALPYATKVTGFLEALQLQTPCLEYVSAGALIAHIDRAWDEREALRARLRTALPALQARARINNDLLLRLLSRPPRTAGEARGASSPAP
jgi:polysaccharide pyruvyl transferase CsaB